MKYRGDHIRVSDLGIGDFIFVKRTLSDDERLTTQRQRNPGEEHERPHRMGLRERNKQIKV